ncbi:MAG: hypothetical protein R2753_12675 [Chitinophagales bacterium]
MNNFRQSKIIFPVLMLLILAFISSCNKTNEKREVKDTRQVVFFDLRSYFNDIIKTYAADSVLVNKQVSFGNKSELKENMAIDWSVELQTFAEADINRSSWIDKFKVDTLTTNNGSTILYQTTDASIPIKQLEVMLTATGKVSEIVIQSERKSLLYKSKQKLNFRPGNSYSIDGWQRTLMLSQTDFEVKADILMSE